MSKRFHIIITGENGKSSSFQLSRRKLVLTSLLSVVSVIVITGGVLVSGGTFFMGEKIELLESELNRTAEEYAVYLGELEQLKNSKYYQIESLKKDYEYQLDSQKVRYDLENTSLQLENVKLMNSAIADLNSRSEIIEEVMSQIGVEIIKPAEETDSSGGPFVPAESTPYEELAKKVDEYLRTINHLPLGRPIEGSISSKFGNRIDPINKKKAFHEGIDIRGRRGDKIRATAAGVVVKRFKNGGFGKYIEIDHGNGYRTVFAHLDAYLVKKGDSIERGQVIGLMGNSGRSTGTHLHYEIRLNKKPINPLKFMKVADLSHTLADSVP